MHNQWRFKLKMQKAISKPNQQTKMTSQAPQPTHKKTKTNTSCKHKIHPPPSQHAQTQHNTKTPHHAKMTILATRNPHASRKICKMQKTTTMQNAIIVRTAMRAPNQKHTYCPNQSLNNKLHWKHTQCTDDNGKTQLSKPRLFEPPRPITHVHTRDPKTRIMQNRQIDNSH